MPFLAKASYSERLFRMSATTLIPLGRFPMERSPAFPNFHVNIPPFLIKRRRHSICPPKAAWLTSVQPLEFCSLKFPLLSQICKAICVPLADCAMKRSPTVVIHITYIMTLLNQHAKTIKPATETCKVDGCPSYSILSLWIFSFLKQDFEA